MRESERERKGRIESAIGLFVTSPCPLRIVIGIAFSTQSLTHTHTLNLAISHFLIESESHFHLLSVHTLVFPFVPFYTADRIGLVLI